MVGHSEDMFVKQLATYRGALGIRLSAERVAIAALQRREADDTVSRMGDIPFALGR